MSKPEIFAPRNYIHCIKLLFVPICENYIMLLFTNPRKFNATKISYRAVAKLYVQSPLL